MSTAHHLNCMECRERVFVGGTRAYFGDDKVRQALGAFLYKHMGCALKFTSEHYDLLEDEPDSAGYDRYIEFTNIEDSLANPEGE